MKDQSSTMPFRKQNISSKKSLFRSNAMTHQREKKESHDKEEKEKFKNLTEGLSEFDKDLNYLLHSISQDFSVESTDNKSNAHFVEEKANTSNKVDSENIPHCDSNYLICKWLEEIGKAHFSHEFLFNGFDDIKYIKNILAPEDLDNLGIYDEKEVNIIIQSIDLLPNPPLINISDPNDFTAKYLLNLCDLDIYYESFVEQGYMNFNKISKLSYLSLIVVDKYSKYIQVFNIQYVGHRKRLMYYIDEAVNLFCKNYEERLDYPEEEKISVDSESKISKTLLGDLSSIPEAPPLFSLIEKLETNPSHLFSLSLNNIITDIETFAVANSTIRDIKEPLGAANIYCQSEAKIQTKASSLIGTKNSNKISQKIGSFFKKIIPPSMKTIPESSTKIESIPHATENLNIIKQQNNVRRNTLVSQTYNKSKMKRIRVNSTSYVEKKKHDIWIHSPVELYQGCVSIESKFLGMYPIKNIKIKGRRIIQDCIEKLAQNEEQFKMPAVSVNISAFDISLINTETNAKICSHDMISVFFCAQDTSDQRVFSYVYREDTNKKFLCNVFRCSSVKICAEAVLAIGLSFKLLQSIL
ncbi:hypothetical protein HZS_1109 [Henneguya salminicola]|nr:hypothetical protein HZS_1109 [Henneguya salminicola]